MSILAEQPYSQQIQNRSNGTLIAPNKIRGLKYLASIDDVSPLVLDGNINPVTFFNFCFMGIFFEAFGTRIIVQAEIPLAPAGYTPMHGVFCLLRQELPGRFEKPVERLRNMSLHAINLDTADQRDAEIVRSHAAPAPPGKSGVNPVLAPHRH